MELTFRPGQKVRILGTTYFCLITRIDRESNKAVLWDLEIAKIRTKKERLNNLEIIDY